MAAPQARRGTQSAAVDYDIAEEDEYYVTRPHTSVRRYQQPTQRDTLDDYAPEQAELQRRRASTIVASKNSLIAKAIDPSTSIPRKHRKRSPWPALIIGMLLMIALVASLSFFSSWWQVHQNDITYGRPRTYQTEAVVGHHDSKSTPSHFIFLNLNGRVVITEFPGGDPTRAITYSGPTLFGDNNDLTPITGEFRDVNGDGRPDMLVHIQGQTLVYINDGTKFRPLQSSDHINL